MNPKNRIKRLVIAAEMDDGTTTMLYTDDPWSELSTTKEVVNQPEFDEEGRCTLPPVSVYHIAIENVETLTYAFPTEDNDAKAREVISVVAEHLGKPAPATPST